MTLYIIGNGFDLSHNLNTSFKSFKKFMQKESKESIEKWQQIVSIDLTENWSNLEESFEKVDYDYILETCSNYLNNYNENYNNYSNKIDYKQELNKYLDLALKADYYLRKWLKNIELPHKEKYNLEKNNLYLTFNYTNLLEKTYKIKKSNICHIHGDLDYKNRLILGHDNPKIIENIKNTPSNDTRIIALNEIVNDSKYKSYKNSNILMKENKDFFTKCRNVENIYIIGHSCESISKVDSEYYKKIASIVDKNNINIYVIYYNASDIPKYTNALTLLGFKNIYFQTYEAIKI